MRQTRRMTPEEFRRLGHALVDWIAGYRERLPSLPVMSPVAPGAIRARFPEEPPAEGGRLAEAIASLDDAVVPGITHWNHPALLRLLPVEHEPRVGARRPRRPPVSAPRG